MSSIAQELARLTPSARITLFVVDITALGGPVLRLHNGANELSQPLVWQGQSYSMLPIEASGFDRRADGPAPRPMLRVGNAQGLVSALARQFRHLAGATLVRKVTRAKYLDAVNFASGLNPSADPTAQMPDEVWRFDRVARRDKTVLEWELVSPFDAEGVMLPRRQIRAAVCGSAYRSSECGYAGPAVAKADDTPTNDILLDRCSLKVSGCKLRFGATAALPIDIFPGAGVLRNL